MSLPLQSKLDQKTKSNILTYPTSHNHILQLGIQDDTIYSKKDTSNSKVKTCSNKSLTQYTTNTSTIKKQTIIQLWVTKWSLPHKFLIPKIETRETTLKAVRSCLLDFLCLSSSVERMNR